MTEPIPTITAQIKGYRQLSQEEQDLINEIKDEGERVGHLVNRVLALSLKTKGESGPWCADMVWATEAKMDLKKGFMSLVRAVAQPNSF